MNKKKFLVRLASNRKNVRYRDFVTLLKAFGFMQRRSEGSHNIYKHERLPISVNAQNLNGEAKPYQIEQFLRLIEKYDLKMRGDEEETNNA